MQSVERERAGLLRILRKRKEDSRKKGRRVVQKENVDDRVAWGGGSATVYSHYYTRRSVFIRELEDEGARE
jgi:hypothetical protein